MIIYIRDLDYKEVDALVNVPERLRKYARELVPEWAKCFPGIIDNQCFYVAIQVRSLLNIPYKVRKAAVDCLCENIALSGLTTECITVREVLAACNMESLRAILSNYYEQRNP